MDFETSIEGDTVDKIAYRRRGTVAIVEAIYALNRGLARFGAVLPAGIRVYLPAPPTARTVRKVPRIWS